MTGPESAPNPIMGIARSAGRDFAGRDLLDSMRAGDLPTGEDAEDLHTAPVMGDLRKLIEPSDLQWLLPLIQASDEQLAGLAISLLAAHSCQTEVQFALREAWVVATPYIRSVLMWRLIDDPELPVEWHERLYTFAIAEADLYHSTCLRFFGGTEEGVIAMVLERFCSPHIPETKKWAYLCSLVRLGRYPCAVSTILRMGLTSNNEFTARVAKQLIDQATAG